MKQDPALSRIITAFGLMGGLMITPAAYARQNSPAAQSTLPNRVQVGDVVIERFGRIRSEGKGFARVTLTGADSFVTVRDRKSGAVLRLQADPIVVESEGKIVGARVEMTGSVRFTVTQALPGGQERVLKGTAGRGAYRQTTQSITLSGGVKADLTDPQSLGENATLSARAVTVDMSKNPPIFTISGEGSEIEFAPKRKGTSNAPDVNRIRATDFSSGTFQAGKTASFQGTLRDAAGKFWGDGPTLEFANETDKTNAKLQAERVGTAFDANGRVRSAEAEGKARGRVERPAPAGKYRQAAQTTAQRAVYDLEEGLVRFVGAVRAEVEAPGSLAAPALLRGSEISVRTKADYRYDIRGDAADTLFRFEPLPPPADPAVAPVAAQNGEVKPAPRRFGFGQSEVRGFKVGSFTPGEKLVLEGGRPLFTTNDRLTQSSTRVEAERFQADFADNRTVREARMTGNVRYALTQMVEGVKQALEGTAVNAVFVTTATAKTVTLQGPLLATITAPEQLVRPGKASGQTGDTFVLDLSSSPFAFEMISPNRTGTIQFEPREQEEPKSAEAKPATAKPGTKKR